MVRFARIKFEVKQQETQRAVIGQHFKTTIETLLNSGGWVRAKGKYKTLCGNQGVRNEQ